MRTAFVRTTQEIIRKHKIAMNAFINAFRVTFLKLNTVIKHTVKEIKLSSIYKAMLEMR